MDDIANILNTFLVWPLPETAMGIPCICPAGAILYAHCCVIRPFHSCGAKVLRPARMTSLGRQPRCPPKTKTVPWFSSSRSERRVLQHRHRPTPIQPIRIIWGGGGRQRFSAILHECSTPYLKPRFSIFRRTARATRWAIPLAISDYHVFALVLITV